MELKQIERKNINLLNLLVLGFTVLSVIMIVFILGKIQSGGELLIDRAVEQFAESIANSVVVAIFTLFTELGSKYGIGGLFLVSLVFFWWKYRDYAAMAVVTLCVIGGDQLNKWLKEEVGRERPLIDPSIYAEGFSFPSGHAMVGLTFYGFIAYFFVSRIKNQNTKLVVSIGMGILIFLIGFSRVVLNAHYPSDVFGGFAIGFLFLLIAIYVYKDLKNLLKRS